MKLLLALAAMFTFLAFCSWFSTPGGFLGACDYVSQRVLLAQAQDGEQQQQDMASDVLNTFPNERTYTYTLCNGQSVEISQVTYTQGFLARYGERIRLNANRYRPGMSVQLNNSMFFYVPELRSADTHLII